MDMEINMEELDLDQIGGFNQSQTFEIGNNSVWFPKAGIKINNEGMRTLQDGSKIEAGAEAITPDQIQIGEVIGQGVSSYVCRGLYVPYNYQVAVKVVNVFDKDKRHQMINDLKTFLTGYDCQNLIRFIGAFYEEGTIKIVLEHMDQGSLRNVIQKVGKRMHLITEEFLATVAKEILLGLAFLHRTKHQLHRDIKPENVLLDSSGQLKLTDFGISKQLDKTYGLTNTFVGTLVYMSPERMGGKNYSYSADVWALGIILHELATGQHPYLREKQTYIELIQTILKQPSPTLESEKWSPDFKEFLRMCLEKEDAKRGAADTLLKNPWLKQQARDSLYLQQWLKELNQ